MLNINKLLALWCLLFLIHNNTWAQFNETIRTGRPGQAIGPFAVGKYVFQSQTGVDFGGFNESNNRFSSKNIAPNTVLRFGVTKKLELNTAWEYRNDQYHLKDSLFSTRGISVSSVGTRIHLLDAKGIMPAIGLQFTLRLPVTPNNYLPQHVAPKALLIMSKQISDKVVALVNTGINYTGTSLTSHGVYVVNISYAINSKWGTFIENYGTFTSNSFNSNWDTGLAYLLNNNLQLDVYGGINYDSNRLDYFTSIGISWRVVTLRQQLTHKN
jgi:hypothetical protein